MNITMTANTPEEAVADVLKMLNGRRTMILHSVRENMPQKHRHRADGALCELDTVIILLQEMKIERKSQ